MLFRSLTPLDECGSSPTVGSFTPVTEWSWDTFTTEPTSENVMMTPIVVSLTDDDGDGDADEDDTPDIVFVTYVGTNWTGEGVLRAVSGDGSAEIFNATGYSIDGCSGVAGGDLDGDGWTDLVVVTTDKKVRAFEADGTLKWTSSAYTSNIGSYSSTPAIADMDGDGYAEIIAGSNILSYDGTLLGHGEYGVGSCPNEGYGLLEGSISVPVDLNGDGELEVVVGNAAYEMDGTALYTNGLDDGNVAIADFDLDGEPEIVVASGNDIYTLESDMTPTGWSDEFQSTNYIGPIAADDLDGDGAPEFVAVGSSQMRAYTWSGRKLWTQRITDASGAAGPIMFDFEMDGYPEIIHADEVSIKVFNGLDGSIKLESDDHSSYTLFETPAVADVDNDGEVEIILAHGQGTYGLTVYGDADHSWPPGRPIWNQHAYSITNVDDDGGIPTSQTPKIGRAHV